ncbi:MAG TPA: nuclear pore complex subunit [Bacteroidales bacterium]|nr:nuclear pore complex subunit [Bacteroidales bacterium]
MKDLYIDNTPSTPEINFKSSGHLSIKGKSLPEDPKKFYGPIFKWADNICAKEVELDIKLEYVNTSSSKRIIEFIKSLDNNRKIKKINLNWFYEADDPDMLEFGEMIQHSLRRTKSSYIEYEDSTE